MIAKLLAAFAILLLQETVTLTSLLFTVHRGGYPTLVIHLLFLVATCIDSVVGFYAGRMLKNFYIGIIAAVIVALLIIIMMRFFKSKKV